MELDDTDYDETCETCRGVGEVATDPSEDSFDWSFITCPDCDGRGVIFG